LQGEDSRTPRRAVRVFDVMRDILTGQNTPTSGANTAAQMMEDPTPQDAPDKRRRA
jgi:hypothetical protein